MIILSSTTDTIRIALASTVATTELDLVASWRDITSAPTYAAGRSLARTNGTTPVIWIASPAASTQRIVDHMRIINRDTAPAIVSVVFSDNGTEYVLWAATLAPGETALVHPIENGQPGPSGIDGANGSLIVSEAEIDLGSVPVTIKTVTVAAPGVTPTSKIIAAQSGAAATDRTVDENTADVLVMNCTAGTDEFTVTIFSATYVSGKFKINYQFS